jgi:hypothetical protein
MESREPGIAKIRALFPRSAQRQTEFRRPSPARRRGAPHPGLLDRASDEAGGDDGLGELLDERGGRRPILGISDRERVTSVVAGNDDELGNSG